MTARLALVWGGSRTRVFFRRAGLAIGFARSAWITAAVLLALPALGEPADGAHGDIPVTDSMLLERLGFEPDATNVYATPAALEELLTDPAERAANQEARLAEHRAARESSPAGGPYGTATFGYTPVSAHGIRPRTSSTQHGTTNGLRERICTSGSPFFDAYFEGLPHGARLGVLDVWYRDDSFSQNITTTLYRVCQPDFQSGQVQLVILGSLTSFSAPGNAYGFIFLDEDIDLQSCAYFAAVKLGDNCSEGSALAIQKVRAEWRRQVSPPPDTATFNDVPTSHPFFRYIEALVASGITGGCTADDYCPNAPLTRGQMAVFLAKALGLHWGPF